MGLKISERRIFLSERKSAGNRLTIGFAGIADLRSFIGLEYIKGMTKACIDYDINFINMGGAVKYSIFEDMNFTQNYIKNFKFMKQPFIDGLVTWTSSLWDFMREENIVKLFSDMAPLPMVDIGHMNIPNVTHLKIDSSSAITQLMEHLVKNHGYTKFAFFGADVSQPHWNRLFTYRSNLKKHGLQELPDSVYMCRSMSEKHILEKTEELLKHYTLSQKKELDCIITTTDIIASILIEQLNARGVSVPKDIAVTGFNNWYEGITARSPLTTIDLSYYDRGYAAIEVLIDKIATQSRKEETILFPTKLVIRQSCGCLENEITSAGDHNITPKQEPAFDFSRDFSEIELREYLTTTLKHNYQEHSRAEIEQWIDNFFYDLYTRNEESRMLQQAKDTIQNIRKKGEFIPDLFQESITKFRNTLLPFLKTEGIDSLLKMENIFHQMRSLVSLFQKYESLADRENPYQINNISERAVSFTSSQTIEETFNILSKQLEDFSVPSAVIALNDTATRNFPSPKLSFFYPEETPRHTNLKNTQIQEPHFFPKEAFPQNRRYTMILEVLSAYDFYFGYAFFEMKNESFSIYEVLRLLLSNALYSIYKNTGKITNSIQPTLNQITSIISGKKMPLKHQRLTQDQITSYLLQHLGEKTDIKKMAEFFLVSKSYLSKKTKELTGCTVQSLHEKIKIEQAKNMLLSETYELSKIAEKLGFQNQNYFSNVFKKNTGQSPKNWLKSQ